MEEYYIGYVFDCNPYPPDAVIWCNAHNAYIKRNTDAKWQIYENEPYVPSVSDYDHAMEDYCKQVRIDRGYTTNSPVDYYNSANERWAQDARDYIAFRDEILEYALEVENEFDKGGDIPTLDEFKAHLNTIKCHWTYEL